MDIKKFVIDRLKIMHKAPKMWAFCREAFVAQLYVLGELLEMASVNEFLMQETRLKGTCATTDLTIQVDDAWARKIVEKIQELIAKQV